MAIVGFSGCNPKETIPSYLHIKTIDLTTNYTTQGYASSDLSDAWVFVNGKYIGTFELPVTVPVQAAGKVKVTVLPGIKENGLRSSHHIYKVVTDYNVDVILTPGKVDTVKPTVTYKTSAYFDWIEDFEDNLLSLVKSGKSNTKDSIKIVNSSDPDAFPADLHAQYTGKIELKADDSFRVFEVTTLKEFQMPVAGSDVYVEVDIKTDRAVQFGIYTDKNSFLEQIPVVIVYPTDGKWKKLYLNFISETSALSVTNKTKLFIGFSKGQGDNTSSKVMLDNLKLVYLK